jgi:hypothetical protein
VQKPTALGAGNNGFVRAQGQAGLGGDFHVAACADIVLNGNDGARIFGFEETLVAFEKFLIDSLESGGAALLDFFDALF